MSETRQPSASTFPLPPLRTICGRHITTLPEYYYPTSYQDGTLYFCTEFCLDAFRADPDRFYLAHSRTAKLSQVHE
jgi:YHS domain-containing protein